MTNNISYEDIDRLTDKACEDALLLMASNEENRKVLEIWQALCSGRNSLGHLLHNKDEQSPVIKKIFKLKLIKSILLDTLLCIKSSKQHAILESDLVNKTQRFKEINIGIHGMHTEYIPHGMTKRLRHFVQKIECSDTIDGLSELVQDLLCLPSDDYSAIDTQLFYADMIYDRFNEIIQDILNINSKLGLTIDALPRLRLYTWLGGDQDGIPFTTRASTEAIIGAFRKRIQEHYLHDLTLLAQKYPNIEFTPIFNTVKTATHPDEVICLLGHYDWEKYPEIVFFRLKLQTFGFHYLELEFRENSRVIHEAIGQIIERDEINQCLNIDQDYWTLTEQEREALLNHLLTQEGTPERLVHQFLGKNNTLFELKVLEYRDKSIYEIHALDYSYLLKYNAKRVLNWFFLIKENQDAINKFGIAETKSITDVLAVLFFIKASLKEKSIHIVFQPEGPDGAKDLYKNIHKLYQNEAYNAYLKKNQNKQYITFGPSDICKQGGKGMHIANMQLANIYRITLKNYGVNLVTNIVIGHEHARCNNPVSENLLEFGVNQGNEVRYMLAGLNEMRHVILSPQMIRNFFNTIYCSQFLDSGHHSSNLKSYEENYAFWIQPVDVYESFFFKQAYLPKFLKDFARLDVIRQVTQDTRPQSRKYWLELAEEDPTQIRAVAWIRSLLFSGLHFEWMGSTIWTHYSTHQLHRLFNENQTFRGYIKNIAYACARTNMKIAWRTLQLNEPSFADLKLWAKQEVPGVNSTTQQMIANIHVHFLQSMQLVFKAAYNKSLSEIDLFEIDRFSILSHWKYLSQEVILREKNLVDYYEIIVNCRRTELDKLDQSILKDIYATFLTLSNTATTHYLFSEKTLMPDLAII